RRREVARQARGHLVDAVDPRRDVALECLDRVARVRSEGERSARAGDRLQRLDDRRVLTRRAVEQLHARDDSALPTAAASPRCPGATLHPRGCSCVQRGDGGYRQPVPTQRRHGLVGPAAPRPSAAVSATEAETLLPSYVPGWLLARLAADPGREAPIVQ